MPTKEDAEDLFTLVGTVQYHEHDLMPGQPWYKINVEVTHDGVTEFKRHLDLSDLDIVTAKLKEAWDRIVQRRKELEDGKSTG